MTRTVAAVAGRLREVRSNRELARYLADLRMRHRRLPALQDELDRVFRR